MSSSKECLERCLRTSEVLRAFRRLTGKSQNKGFKSTKGNSHAIIHKFDAHSPPT
jgi:hypothetical protein